MRRARPLMIILIVSLLLSLALLLGTMFGDPALPAADGQVRVTQVDASAYPEVAVYAAVGDPADSLRTNLTRSDFQIIEDGQPVELTGFVGAGGSAISTALVIDRSGSMEDADKIEGARQAADAFVELLRPGDQVALVAFNDEVRTLEPFGADQVELQSAIERLRADGGTALYDSIVAGVDLLRDQPGRRVLLVLTDGQDCRDVDSCPDEAGSSHSLDAAIDYAVDAGQAVYLVGLGERGDSGDSGIDEGVLRQIAADTAGAYYYSPDAADLADLYTSLAGSLQREYRLTYVSPRPFYDGMRRDIRVIVAGASASAGYTERHLINVASGPLAGLALLVPLLGLLALPGLLAARRKREGAAPAATAGPRPLPESGPPVIVVRPEPEPTPAAAISARCPSCGAALRPGARFCGSCGVTQAAAPTPGGQRTFCDMCGRPLAPGACLCGECGEPVTNRRSYSA